MLNTMIEAAIYFWVIPKYQPTCVVGNNYCISFLFVYFARAPTLIALDHLYTNSYLSCQQIVFVFQSPYNPGDSSMWVGGGVCVRERGRGDVCVCVTCVCDMRAGIHHTVYGDHLVTHGDGVKDIAFSVEDCRALFKVQITTFSCSISYLHASISYRKLLLVVRKL